MRTGAPDRPSVAASAENSRNSSAGPVSKDGSGFFFTARALRQGPGGDWTLVRLGGPGAEFPRRFSARLPEGTAPGALFRFRAAPSGALDLVASASRSPVPPPAGGPLPGGQTAVTAALFALARAWGFSLPASTLDRLGRSILRAGGDPHASSLVALAAADKGLELSDRSLAEVVARIDPRGGGGGAAGKGDSSGGGHQGDGTSGEDPSAEAAAEAEASPLTAASVSADCRAAVDAREPLAFLNAVSGPEGARWLFFPLHLSQGKVEIQGGLRVLSKSGQILYLYLDVVAPSRYWSFEMPAGLAPGAPARIAADPPLGALAGRVRSSLSAALAPLGVVVAVDPSAPGRPGPEGPAGLPVRLEA